MYFVSAWRIRAIHAKKIVSTDHVRLGKKRPTEPDALVTSPAALRHMVKSDLRSGMAGPSMARLPGSCYPLVHLFCPGPAAFSRPMAGSMSVGYIVPGEIPQQH